MSLSLTVVFSTDIPAPDSSAAEVVFSACTVGVAVVPAFLGFVAVFANVIRGDLADDEVVIVDEPGKLMFFSARVIMYTVNISAHRKEQSLHIRTSASRI